MATEVKSSSVAGIAAELKNKIGALCLAALNPELERTEHSNYHPVNTAKIERCAEEADALVDRLAKEAEHAT